MRSPFPISALTAALALAGCASGNSVPAATINDRILMTDQNGHVYHTTDMSTAQNFEVAAPPATTLAFLNQTYNDLHIPIATLSTESSQVGNKQFRVVGHSLAGHRLSLLLDCGVDPSVGVSRADAYDVTMSILSTAIGSGANGTTVTTDVEASARPIGVSGDALHCTTTGRLEDEIRVRVLKAVASS
jgi:hypothetical protein